MKFHFYLLFLLCFSNTKSQTFDNPIIPNSIDFKVTNSITNLSEQLSIVIPYSNNLKLESKLTFVQISHDHNLAVAVTSSNLLTNNQGYLINLNDGSVIFNFQFEKFNHCFFSPSDSDFYYCDNLFVKKINVFNFSIQNIFEISSPSSDYDCLFLESNKLHYCNTKQIEYKTKFIHYCFDLGTQTLNMTSLDKFDYPILNDIEQEFNAIQGTLEEKLLTLKIIHQNKIIVKQIYPSDISSYVIINYPEVFVLRNGVFIYKTEIQINSTDSLTNTVTKTQLNFSTDSGNYSGFEIDSMNNLIITTRNSIYILPLKFDFKAEYSKTMNPIFTDPKSLTVGYNDGFRFVDYNFKSNVVYYQLNIGYGCDYDDDFVLFTKNLNQLFKSNHSESETILHNYLNSISLKLTSYYNSKINKETLKNRPFETNKEMYNRIQVIADTITPIFTKIQDSLFQVLNNIIIDSIKTYEYDAHQVFLPEFYDLTSEFWNLHFSNPYDGSSFLLIFHQTKESAKLWALNNYSNITIQSKFYFNVLSEKFEPLSISITDGSNKTSNNFIVPYKSEVLLKNLFLTNNSYFIDDYYSSFIHCELERGEVSIDPDIFRYFVAMGKPGYYFNYNFDSNFFDKNSELVLNIDDPKFNYTFHDENVKCCPDTFGYKEYGDESGEYLRFNNVPYFIDKSFDYSGSHTLIYKFPELNSIDTIKGYNYPILNLKDNNSKILFSPNRKFFATRNGVYLSNNGAALLNFDNLIGNIYWDCNSNFIGIGDMLIPIFLLEQLMNK